MSQQEKHRKSFHDRAIVNAISSTCACTSQDVCSEKGALPEQGHVPFVNGKEANKVIHNTKNKQTSKYNQKHQKIEKKTKKQQHRSTKGIHAMILH